MSNSNYNTSAAPLVHGLGWPTIKQLIFKETASLMYKSLHSMIPDYLSSIFTGFCDSSERDLHSRDLKLKTKISLLKTEAGQKSFSYGGATLWNSLDKASTQHVAL